MGVDVNNMGVDVNNMSVGVDVNDLSVDVDVNHYLPLRAPFRLLISFLQMIEMLLVMRFLQRVDNCYYRSCGLVCHKAGLKTLRL